MRQSILSIFLFTAVLFVTRLSGQIITTVAGGVTGHGGYWGDGGPATDAQIGGVGSIAIDVLGNIFIADGDNERIRKVNRATGIITTIAGTGLAGYNGDNILATSAKLNNPEVLSLDKAGNLYIGDEYNYRIRKVDIVTGIITTIAGNGSYGNSGDGSAATAAEIFGDGSIVLDTFNNLYFGCGRSVRKVNAFGIISTIAGNGLPGITGEGVQASATSVYPEVLCTDVIGNIYFSDTTSSIRRIDLSTGIINRIAGTGDNIYSPYSGNGLPATDCHIGPFGIAIDLTSNIYIADYSNSRVEKVIRSSDTINSIAGIGILGFSGDDSSATLAKLSNPEGIALDACGNVYIADFGNYRIRKVILDTSCNLSALHVNKVAYNFSFSVFPNPAHDEITITANAQITEISISNLLGQTVLNQEFDKEKAVVNIEGLPPGLYFVKVNGIWVQKLIKE